MRVVGVVQRARRLSAFKRRWCVQSADHINAALPDILPRTFEYMDSAMQLEATIRAKLQAMPPAEFIGILRPAFQADELKLILVGGLLGAAAGALQQFAIFDML